MKKNSKFFCWPIAIFLPWTNRHFFENLFIFFQILIEFDKHSKIRFKNDLELKKNSRGILKKILEQKFIKKNFSLLKLKKLISIKSSFNTYSRRINSADLLQFFVFSSKILKNN